VRSGGLTPDPVHERLAQAARGADLASFGVTYGEDIGRYLNYLEGAVYDPSADAIVLERAIGGYVGYQFKPSGVFRVNLAYGLVHEFDNDYTKAAHTLGFDSGRFGVNRNVQQGHAGFFVTPVKTVDIGLEGIWANRMTLAGEKGEDLRLNLLTRHYINY